MQLISHSFSSVSYCRPIAFPKASSSQGAVSCFPILFPVSSRSLRLFSRGLRIFRRLLVTYILPSISPSITCFEESSYLKCDQSN